MSEFREFENWWWGSFEFGFDPIACPFIVLKWVSILRNESGCRPPAGNNGRKPTLGSKSGILSSSTPQNGHNEYRSCEIDGLAK